MTPLFPIRRTANMILGGGAVGTPKPSSKKRGTAELVAADLFHVNADISATLRDKASQNFCAIDASEDWRVALSKQYGDSAQSLADTTVHEQEWLFLWETTGLSTSDLTEDAPTLIDAHVVRTAARHFGKSEATSFQNQLIITAMSGIQRTLQRIDASEELPTVVFISGRTTNFMISNQHGIT
ncbi:hypothetical protein OC834_007702, partial [Tilletia horrida]